MNIYGEKEIECELTSFGFIYSCIWEESLKIYPTIRYDTIRYDLTIQEVPLRYRSKSFRGRSEGRRSPGGATPSTGFDFSAHLLIFFFHFYFHNSIYLSPKGWGNLSISRFYEPQRILNK